jgi:hypothetical protein
MFYNIFRKYLAEDSPLTGCPNTPFKSILEGTFFRLKKSLDKRGKKP